MAMKLNDSLIESISDMYQMGYSAKIIAESLDINIRTVFFYVKELGIANRRNTIDTCKEEVISSYLDGKKLKDISDEFNISVSAICKMLRRENIKREERKIDDNRIIDSYISGMSARSAGEENGVSESYVLNLLKDRGIERRDKRECQTRMVDRKSVLRLRESGMSNAQIAEELGCSVSTVVGCARELGIAHSSLSDEEIVDAFNTTTSMELAAKKLGVHESTIQRRAKELGLDVKKNKKRGKEHYCWAGGITGRIDKIRKSEKYLEWKRAIYKRDGHKCSYCGRKDMVIHAHHIVPIYEDESKIFDVNNGITLCRECHEKTYGKEKEFIPVFQAIIKD